MNLSKGHKHGLAWAAAGMILLAGAAGAGEIEEQLHFGNLAAQKGLWGEAVFRWKRVLALDPNNAKAHNNLAVAHERDGDFEAAAAAYQAALRGAAPPEARENFQRFRQLRDQRLAKPAAAASQPQSQP
jgi:Flp pilus assembly protein TadD